MTGPEHYREAERLIRSAGRPDTDGPYYMDDQMPTLAAAQVHATLALAAATAVQPSTYASNRPEWRDWIRAITGVGGDPA